MKKRHKIKLPAETEIKNPVAKYAGQFNKAQAFKDKTKYQRGAKHKGREPFIMSLDNGIAKGGLFLQQLTASKVFAAITAFQQPFAG